MDEQTLHNVYRQLPLSDDFMFGEVMRRPEICRLFLEALFGKRISRIEYITKQQELSDSYTSHGIRLDVYLRDSENTVYSVEMQNGGGTVLFKRIRYYQGVIDRHNLQKGTHYSELPESFIIMICTVDLIGRGLAVYQRKVTVEGCEDYCYDDGTHVYLLNSAYREGNADSAILEFLQCIRTNDTDIGAYTTPLMKEICPVMAEIRRDPGKEAEYMTWQTRIMDIEHEAMEKGRAEGRAEGRTEGRTEGREEGVQALVHTLQGLSVDREIITQQLTEQFGFPLVVASKKVDQYWKS